MKPIHFLGILFVIVGYYNLKIFEPFLENIIIASLLAIATSKIFHFLRIRTNNNLFASVAITILIAIVFFAPIVYIVTVAAVKISQINLSETTSLFLELKIWLKHFIEKNSLLNYPAIKEFLNNIEISSYTQKIAQIASYIAAKSANFLKDILLILIFYFFANLYGKELIAYIEKIIPLPQKEINTLFESLANVMGVVFSSILATAIFEGILFGIIAQIYGYNGIMFAIFYGFASLIPVVGGILMWLPLSLHQYFLGNTSASLIIAFYSIIIISIVADTFIKPLIIKFIDEKLIKKEVFINELLIFFSIVAGLSTYGFWGMIIAPALLTLLISILNIYPQLKKH
jgi:predicted PurR-regulated permease PerM